jgi:phosphoadenosine phosphosulfate reductase
LSDIFWCNNCKVPLLKKECGICHDDGQRVASDIRPVFPEEKRLLEVLLEYEEGYFRDKSVWDTNSNYLLIDGVTVALNKGKLMKLDPGEIRLKLKRCSVPDDELIEFEDNVDKFVRCNQNSLNESEIEAFDIIKEARMGRDKHISMVSFSGGKDSTVVSDLVRRAYANQSVLHIFGDTTLELPDTQEYVARFKKFHNKTPFLESRSHHNFRDLCEQIGPPSRVMRWCCTIFKTGPISQTFDGISRTKSILTYYGIRKSESNQRANYKAITQSPKVTKQTVVSPIINWIDANIWLYILSRKLDFNDAYRYGFSRVGCWACPSNSLWAFFLTRIYFPEFSEPWREFLIEVAVTMGKPDPEEYVDSGNWKARQGGQGLTTAYKGLVTSKPCGDDPDAKTYTLTKPISEELYEYFKPFGDVAIGRGRSLLGEVFILNKHTQEPLLVIQGRTGTSELRVKVVSSKNTILLMHRVDCQIRKYQSCVLCSGCSSVCPLGAISDKAGRYTINQEKCVNCLKCVAHFDTGCLVSKVLQTRRS